MKAILNKLFEQQKLTSNEAQDVLLKIAANEFNSSQIAAFLTVYLMRPISVEELSGFRSALLNLAVKVDFSAFNTIDLCGTGGDGKNTFNISTVASFVVAGTGHKVAKHGNYGISSISGSSNMLEYLGYTFTKNEFELKKQLEKSNICFLHAPLFHPAMKAVAPVRKQLATKTFFNMLGPLVNPSNPQNQLIGVYNLEVARLYNYLLQTTKLNYSIVHSLDGYDEVSLTNSFKIITKNKEFLYNPKELGFNPICENDILGGNSIKQAAEIFISILNGKGSEIQNNVVCTNAAFALKTINNTMPFIEAFEMAKDSLLSLKAKKCLTLLLN